MTNSRRFTQVRCGPDTARLCGVQPGGKASAGCSGAGGRQRHKLRQMSETLAGARQLTFKATRQLDAGLVEGSAVPESTEVEIAVSRPGMVRARSVSEAGVRRFYADGTTMSLLDETMNVYATVPAAGNHR